MNNANIIFVVIIILFEKLITPTNKTYPNYTYAHIYLKCIHKCKNSKC